MARDTSNVFENFIAIRVSEVKNEISFISRFRRTNIAIKVTLQKKQFAQVMDSGMSSAFPAQSTKTI